MDESVYLLPEGKRHRRWSWWQYLLLPLALPVLIVRLLFYIDPRDHRGVTAFVLAITQTFFVFMVFCALFAGLSWIFPFSYAGNPDHYTVADFKPLFPDGCDNHYQGVCRNYSYLDHVQIPGKAMFIIGWTIGYPVRLFAWFTGLDFFSQRYFWAASIGAHEMVTTGHLGLQFLIGMAVVYWLFMLIPLWLIWSVVHLAMVIAGKLL